MRNSFLSSTLSFQGISSWKCASDSITLGATNVAVKLFDAHFDRSMIRMLHLRKRPCQCGGLKGERLSQNPVLMRRFTAVPPALTGSFNVGCTFSRG
jgi:hypothetical protein